MNQKHNCDLSDQLQLEEGRMFKHQNKLGNISVEGNSKFCPCEKVKMTFLHL